MLTSIPSLSYNYYHNEIKNYTFNNQEPKKISSRENIPSLEGDPLNHEILHHQSKNGTITFPLKAKIMRNPIIKGYVNNNTMEKTFTKGSLLFCLEEEDVCTIVEEDDNHEKEKNVPYWKRWNFVGYVRNELEQTQKAKGYHL